MDFLHIVRVAWFTFFQAACSTLMALAIGFPAAFFCGKRSFHGRRFLLSLSVVPFCLPSLIIALGYVSFLGRSGFLNSFLMWIFGLKEPPFRILYSFMGLVVAHGFYNFPLIMKNVSSAWEKLPEEQTESARLLGASEWRIFRTVTVFQLLPSVLSSCLLVFIYCFLSFVLVLLFGGVGNSTLEVEIYHAARATLDFKTAFVLGAVETAILCIMTALYGMIESKYEISKGLEVRESSKKKIKGVKEWSIFVVLMLIIFIFFLAPLLCIVFNAFTSSVKDSGITLTTFARVVSMRSFWPSLGTTITVGIFTGVLCTFLGALYAVFLRCSQKKANGLGFVVLKVLPMLPMCISSVVLGVIITLVVRRGNLWCLVLAQSLLSWPLAFRVIYSEIQKIPADTIDSGMLLSRNSVDCIFRVVLPQCRGSLLSAFGFSFAVSAGDTTLPLILSIPGFNNLSLFTYRLAGAYRFNEACAAGVILAALCALVFYGCGIAGKKISMENRNAGRI